MSKPDPTIEQLKERAWREVVAIDRALAEGRIDEAGWHEAMAALIKPAYLAADNPYAQAGHGGDAETWEASRGLIAQAMHRSGTFLDVGCASGVVMESVHRWGAARNLSIEPYGLDIVPEFVELARRRLPHWADRIWTASPVCNPSRACLMTGRYPQRTGSIDTLEWRGLDRLALRETTLAQVLKSAGYATGLVGKWHLGAFDMRYHPLNRGFDETVCFRGGSSGTSQPGRQASRHRQGASERVGERVRRGRTGQGNDRRRVVRNSMANRSKANSTGEYIAEFPADTQKVLQELRALLRASAPDATETISYAIPTFDLNGRHLVHFAAYAKHIGFYPTGSGIEAFKDELGPYKRAKGSVQFPLDRPLPTDLIRRIVEFRVQEVTERDAKQGRRARKGGVDRAHPPD